ncbi:MAG: aminopeptidase [Ruminococcaceae bacterium]|nr:aminopeptidase [Oscillospiraceae bacterium]
MKKTILRKYARLIAAEGGKVQKGQDVLIYASVEQPEFAKMVVEECYRCGARRVMVEWEYQPISKLNVKACSVTTLSKLEDWEVAKWQYQVDRLPVKIYLDSDDPDGMKGINQAKYSKAMQARYKVIKPFREAMENKYQWCIAAVPGAAWAKKVFPGESRSRAMELLWEKILFTSRVEEEGDPIAAWEAHNADLAARCAYLNDLGLETLEYRSSNGTDFRVGLIEDALFMGGAEAALGSGIVFNPNIPTEEVFISPKKGIAEGIVYSSKPLSYRGELIENFSIRFENGKAVEVHAEKNEALLQEMISMDEGAAYLGECALVPFESPVNRANVLFYNTLFDENAVCHLALGSGFTNVIKDFDSYTLEECHAKGINDSMIHVDFMIGTEDLSIVGVTRDGQRVQLFQNGTWAF